MAGSLGDVPLYKEEGASLSVDVPYIQYAIGFFLFMYCLETYIDFRQHQKVSEKWGGKVFNGPVLWELLPSIGPGVGFGEVGLRAGWVKTEDGGGGSFRRVYGEVAKVVR